MIKYEDMHFLRKIIAFFCLIPAIYGCASIQQPQGGPRDTTPPQVVKMIPENRTVNFNAKKITIEFDEYFKLQNEFKEFSISPELDRPPLLKKKGKKLEITFPDSLEKNTTYTLNFGKSIADVNESNVAKNLTYVLGTGPKLDSLSISGRITNAITGLPELDVIAFILPLNKDTLFGKGKPSIYTTTDSSGLYTLSNLREDTYKIYALKDKNGDKIYMQSTDEVGFIKDSVHLDKKLDSVNMVIFKEKATTFRLMEKKIGPDGVISMVFNQKLKDPEVTVTEPEGLNASKKIKFSKENDSLRLWLSDLSFDSTKVSIKDNGKLLQTTTLTRGKKETYLRNLMISDNLESALLNPNKGFRLNFNFPIEKIDPSKIILMEDSVPKTDFTLVKDSTDFLSYVLKYPWKLKKTYNIKFEPEALITMYNSGNKEFSKTFTVAGKDNYGTLKVTIVPPEKDKSYILEVINENKAIVNTIVVKNDTTAIFANYRAGKYFIRIIYDTNKNGIWDTGNVAERKQPEKIWTEPKEMSIRALWERNEVINIPPEK